MLFIFDWDGTLSDSTGRITQAMQMAAEDLGWDKPEATEVHNIIGLGLPEAIAKLYPTITPLSYEQLRERYIYHF